MSAVAEQQQTTGSERMTYREALRLALREELARDERVFVMGEEVGVFDGAYKVTAGLLDEFGPDRVRGTLREQGLSDEDLDAIDREVDERVAASVAFADASPEPEVSELARSVYAPGSGGQFARMRPGSPFGEEELVFAAGLGR